MELESVNLVALVVAVLGVGGIGVFFREVVGVITLVRNGVSAKESKRKNDLVYQRDQAINAEELQRRNRIALQEYAAGLRRTLIEADHGDKIGEWPDLEDTVSRTEKPTDDPKSN